MATTVKCAEEKKKKDAKKSASPHNEQELGEEQVADAVEVPTKAAMKVIRKHWDQHSPTTPFYSSFYVDLGRKVTFKRYAISYALRDRARDMRYRGLHESSLSQWSERDPSPQLCKHDSIPSKCGACAEAEAKTKRYFEQHNIVPRKRAGVQATLVPAIAKKQHL